MCGRYYADDETAREIEKVIRQVNEKLKKTAGKENNIMLQGRDIHPTESAPVLTVSDYGVDWRFQRWGFPKQQYGMKGKQVIFNARSEAALEKKMFRESVEKRRIVIPASWFYEWNQNKEKNIFYRKDQPTLFIAGFYNVYGNEEYFVILTTQANESVKPVHDRMPLVLEREEIVSWLSEPDKIQAFLHKIPCLLERKTEFEQMSLF